MRFKKHNLVQIPNWSVNLKNIGKSLITKLKKFKDLPDLSREDLESYLLFIHFHVRRINPWKVQKLDENISIAPSIGDLVIESLHSIEEPWDK